MKLLLKRADVQFLLLVNRIWTDVEVCSVFREMCERSGKWKAVSVRKPSWAERSGEREFRKLGRALSGSFDAHVSLTCSDCIHYGV